MRPYASAFAAALLSTMAAVSGATAQEGPPQGGPFMLPLPPELLEQLQQGLRGKKESCGPLTQRHNNMKNLGEKLQVLGVLSDGDIFMLYGDKKGGGWTIMHGSPDGLKACTKINGPRLNILPLNERGPGIRVDFKMESGMPKDLADLEYNLMWKYQESLQLTAIIPPGQMPEQDKEVQLRLYANTQTGTFRVVFVNEEGVPTVPATGVHYASPETTASYAPAKPAKKAPKAETPPEPPPQ